MTLKQENAQLRQIISDCASALGNGSGIACECSLEFMALLPEEIRAELKSRNASPQVAPTPAQPSLSDRQIHEGWEQTFSTNNPFCPCDLKSFTKAVNWAQRTIATLPSEPEGD